MTATKYAGYPQKAQRNYVMQSNKSCVVLLQQKYNYVSEIPAKPCVAAVYTPQKESHID